MSENVLETSVTGSVLVVTLNRPDARNALNIALTRAIHRQLDSFEADSELKVMVITGADPAFCAGLDLKDFSAPDSPRGEVAAMIDRFPAMSKPVIAAANGPAMTGGLELAMGCDFIIASERARFGDTHTRIGALAGGGTTARLPRRVGAGWAKQMSLTGIPIDAQTALRIGLVNEVVPHDQLLARVMELAETIAGYDAEIVGICKSVIDRGLSTTLSEALAIEKRALAERKARGAMKWNPGSK